MLATDTASFLLPFSKSLRKLKLFVPSSETENRFLIHSNAFPITHDCIVPITAFYETLSNQDQKQVIVYIDSTVPILLLAHSKNSQRNIPPLLTALRAG